jgi:hypothetical protein
MSISVQILVVVGGSIGRTVAGANDGLEGILTLRVGTNSQLDPGSFRQRDRLLGLKRPIGIDGFDGDTHGSPSIEEIKFLDEVYCNDHAWIFLVPGRLQPDFKPKTCCGMFPDLPGHR